MVLNALESLVLRNVNIGNGRLTLEMLRHGPRYQTSCRTPEIPISQRHPSQGHGQDMQPAGRREDVDKDVAATVFGAGRSRRLAGVRSLGSTVLAARTVSFSTGRRDLSHAGSVNETPPTVGVVWCKPATWTPPASTRGKGAW
jgi:hypothetical protein